MLASSTYNFLSCFDDDPDGSLARSSCLRQVQQQGEQLPALPASAMASTKKLTLGRRGAAVITDTSVGGTVTIAVSSRPSRRHGLHTAAEFVAHGGTITQTQRYGTDQTTVRAAVALLLHQHGRRGSGNLLDGVFIQCATDSSFVQHRWHDEHIRAAYRYSDMAGTHYLRLQQPGYSFAIQR